MLFPISFLLLSYLIYHAAVKEIFQTEKDEEKCKEDVTKDVTTLPFSDAVDKNEKDSSVYKKGSTPTTIGYVEITDKPQEKHFQGADSELESSQTDLITSSKKKSIGSSSIPEKHRLISLVMEQEGSQMESPMTESGQWSDTGISGISGNTGDTGSMSKLSKPNQLDLQDDSIDAGLDDLSEISPMNNEEVSTSQHVTAVTESVSDDDPKPSSEDTFVEKETTEKATSPAQDTKVTTASSPMQFEEKQLVLHEEKSTSTTTTTTCDVKLSPILFTENKATSPMSDQSDSSKVEMVDASSSPPTKVVMTSAATSPPKPSDLQSTKSSTPTSSKEKDEDGKDPISFEFDLDLSAQDDLDRIKLDADTVIQESSLKPEKSKNLIEQQTKELKETINQKTAIMLSDEEDKLKKDQEETEKDAKEADQTLYDQSEQKLKAAEIESEKVLDFKTEEYPLLEDEGVDLYCDESNKLTKSTESAKIEISDKDKIEGESYVIVGDMSPETQKIAIDEKLQRFSTKSSETYTITKKVSEIVQAPDQTVKDHKKLDETDLDLDAFEIVSEADLVQAQTAAPLSASGQIESFDLDESMVPDKQPSTISESEEGTSKKKTESTKLEAEQAIKSTDHPSSIARTHSEDTYSTQSERKSEDADSSNVVRDISSESLGFEETKFDEVDELLLVVMPPGQTKVDMKDRDDHEFDQINAPRITITPSFDEADEDELEKEKKVDLEQSEAAITEEKAPATSSDQQSIDEIIQPALEASEIHSYAEDIISRDTEPDLEKIVELVEIQPEMTESEEAISDAFPETPRDIEKDTCYEESKEDDEVEEEKILDGMSHQTEDVLQEEELVPTLCSMAMELKKPNVQSEEHDELEMITEHVIEASVEKEDSSCLENLDDVPTLCLLAKSLVQEEQSESPIHDSKSDSAEPIIDEMKSTEQTTEKREILETDFRLMESFRSHYLVDTSAPGTLADEDLPLEPKQEETDLNIKEQKEDSEIEDEVTPETVSKQHILKITESAEIKGESIEEEQESGLEITAGKDHKSYEDSSVMDHSSDFFGSDKTDSLLQESTLHESYLIEKTLSEQTLEAELPTEAMQSFVEKVEAFEVEPEKLEASSPVGITDSVKKESLLETNLTDESKLSTEKYEISKKTEQVLGGDKCKIAMPEEKTLPLTERKIHDRYCRQEDTVDKSKSCIIPSPITETVELTPILSWQLETGEDEKFEEPHEKATKQSEVSGMSMKLLDTESPRESTDTSTTSPPNTSRCSSHMTERSGTQSSMASHRTTSSRASSFLESDDKSDRKSSVSSHEKASSNASSSLRSASSPPKSSSYQEESSAYSHIHTSNEDEELSSSKSKKISESSSKQVKLSETSPEVAPSSVSELEREAATNGTSSALRKSPAVSNLQHDALSEVSANSLPSSPRRLQRAHSNGVKKLTSELFSTESDISRSLEIVYAEPEENSRRKMSERYRHSSSSGNSDGSITHEDACPGSAASSHKFEKRKPSVTQLRKTSETSKQSSAHSPSIATTETESEFVESSKGTPSEPYDLQHKTETVTVKSHTTKSPTSSPPASSNEKKIIPSPTKIKPPLQSTASLKEQISEEIISPVLEVECHTPEKSSNLSAKGKGGFL